MLSAPGFRLHRARPPFLQLVVGPAHPAVAKVVGYTSFFIVVFLCSCIIFYCLFIFIIFICIARAPAYLGSPGWVFCAWVTHDVTSDSVPFLGFPLLAMPGLVCYVTCSLYIYL